MHTFLFPFPAGLLVFLLLTGCSDSQDPVTEPLAGDFMTAFDLIPLEFAEEGELALASTPIEAAGVFAGFGVVSGSIDQEVDFTVIPTGMSGSAVWSFSNGDELTTTFSAESSFPDENNSISFGGTHTSTGGTGRLVNAALDGLRRHSPLRNQQPIRHHKHCGAFIGEDGEWWSQSVL
jgi:hypothetical protein